MKFIWRRKYLSLKVAPLNFVDLQLEKQKLSPPLLFAVDSLYTNTKKSNLTPDISGMGYTECTKDSVTMLQTSSTRVAIATHSVANSSCKGFQIFSLSLSLSLSLERERAIAGRGQSADVRTCCLYHLQQGYTSCKAV